MLQFFQKELIVWQKHSEGKEAIITSCHNNRETVAGLTLLLVLPFKPNSLRLPRTSQINTAVMHCL